MVTKNKSFVNTNQKGSSLSLLAHPSSRTLCVHYGAGGRAGARATPFLAALFAKQKTKFGDGKARRETRFVLIGCRAGIRTPVPCFRGMCPTARRPGKGVTFISIKTMPDLVNIRHTDGILIFILRFCKM